VLHLCCICAAACSTQASSHAAASCLVLPVPPCYSLAGPACKHGSRAAASRLVLSPACCQRDRPEHASTQHCCMMAARQQPDIQPSAVTSALQLTAAQSRARKHMAWSCCSSQMRIRC
jgi:hypothetical protein